MRAIIDTNVAVVANRSAPQASATCERECITRLEGLRHSGKIILDTGWRVLREYQANLNSSGQPGVGDHFLLWVLENRKNPERCELHPITEDIDRQANFVEFPHDPALIDFDPSDRKFAALAVVSEEWVWNAVDSDWWEYREALERNRIKIEFVCPDFWPEKG